jgi:hypothetical protein
MAAAHSKARRADPVPGQPIVEAASVFSIIDACQDENLFADWFKNRESWAGWFCFLKVMFGLPLDGTELAFFQQCTGRSVPSPLGYLEVSLVIGRRGGKSLILALIATYLACFYNWRPFLTHGERAIDHFPISKGVSRHPAAEADGPARDGRHARFNKRRIDRDPDCELPDD